jgi:hypothetical protein
MPAVGQETANGCPVLSPTFRKRVSRKGEKMVKYPFSVDFRALLLADDAHLDGL